MKKTYVKPEVYFESFELSANIAAGCVFKTYHTEYECTYSVAGKKLFLSPNICTTSPQDYDGTSMCYNNPTDDTKLFSS